MKEFKKSRNINTVEDYIDEANQIFENFLETFNVENGLVFKPNEDDIHYSEDFMFIYTKKGMRLADKMIDLLTAVGEAYFPDSDEEIQIESSLYVSL
jgi:hypothetical protein